LAALPLFVTSCTNQVAQRPSLVLISHSQEIALGDQAAAEILKQVEVVKEGPQVELVNSIFDRLKAALPQNYRSAYKWKVYVVKSDEVNAFALPNGNVFVYTGIIDFVEGDPDALAAILGHEMAHVVLRHGAEKVSQAMLYELGGALLLSQVSPAYRSLAAQLYDLGVGLAILLPYSRRQEREADILGLIIAMRAGFDPYGAVKVWEKMLATYGDREPPEWLSTHPASKTRLEYVKRAIEYLKTHPEYVEKFVIPKELLEG